MSWTVVLSDWKLKMPSCCWSISLYLNSYTFWMKVTVLPIKVWSCERWQLLFLLSDSADFNLLVLAANYKLKTKQTQQQQNQNRKRGAFQIFLVKKSHSEQSLFFYDCVLITIKVKGFAKLKGKNPAVSCKILSHLVILWVTEFTPLLKWFLFLT